ncbi:hypothetical protein [Cylindrospermum sp. FACHB-282]|uniref:hypothetical protein n=1 Tax=Cylindrospermum sp. FACHB-282 TaxID=2692794 RepID=UPI001682BCEC|nr:hypothetical protein [Cylindrospermum sp. FACHB-282]MBD2385173.1 hypothetical protein [Cylindrospermum sp. FACHB-282]
MAESPVINASPLIFLSRGGLLDLLQLLGDEVLVPSAVALEIQQRGAEDPTVLAYPTEAPRLTLRSVG